MHILHVYAGNLFGGIETLLITLAKTQKLCPGMRFQFALCFEGKLSTELQSIGATVHRLSPVRTRHPWTIWRVRQQLKKILMQESFDVVICHACWSQAVFGPVIIQYRIPLVFWCHDALQGKHWLERWASFIKPQLAIANSYYTLNTISCIYPQAQKKVLYAPVTAPDIQNLPASRELLRSSLGASPSDIVIIMAARLERWKGHAQLLNALALLRNEPHWTCWIAGGAQRPHELKYLESLKVQAREAQIDHRVLFLGYRNDVPELLAASDIFCQPNTEPEPFGIAFIEALYAGLPVITSNLGAAQEIIDDSCGYLLSAYDAKILSHQLSVMVQNPLTRESKKLRSVSQAKQLCDPEQQLYRLHEFLSKL